ncbi:MAG TPA: Atxe2 family lasso peptide isopeptidase [Woeseiaceae bacterium]|nr:Atxe2 family lasso peptide isopeptidase [Woeseiaceae bacterium]
MNGNGRLSVILAGLCVTWAFPGVAAAEPPEAGFTAPRVARKITVDDLMRVHEIGAVDGLGLSVSPDGKYVAFQAHQADVASNDYRVTWYVASTRPGGRWVAVADGGDATLFRSLHPTGRIVGAWASEYARWSPDGQWIAYRRKVDGEVQVWRTSVDGARTEPLTHSAADVIDFRWSPDGARLYFITDADRVDLAEAEARRYRNGHVFTMEAEWSTIDARPIYPRYALTGGTPRVWVLQVDSGHQRPASARERKLYEALANPKKEGPAEARTAVRAPDGNGLAWVQADDPEKQGWYPPLTLYASQGGDPVRCAAAECTGIMDLDRPLRDGLAWTSVPDGEIVFVLKEGSGYSKRTWYAWRVGDSRVRKIMTTHEWISDCTVIENRALCFRQQPDHPRTVVAVDLTDGSIETLVDLNPEFRRLRLGEVELFEWTNAKDYGTFGYLVTPPGRDPNRPAPLVLVGYRAKWGFRGGVGDEYPVHVLAANGFVVLVYDTPTTYAAMEVFSDPLDITRVRWGPDLFDVSMPLASFEAAIRILAERGLVDPERVAVTGLSNGAAHVNYAIIHSNLFRAAIASGSNFAPNKGALSGSFGDFIREHRIAMGAGPYPGPNGTLWPEMSLSLNVDRVQTPLLINCNDSEHPWALQEVAPLMEAGKPVEMVVYPDEGHIKWQPAHRVSVYQRNIDWLKFWLEGIEDPDPAKRAQYARWRELRDRHAESRAN